MTALAHAFVQPLVKEQCAAVREGASRVIASSGEGQLDSEAIHDYRVALRRLRTLLKAAAPLFKRRPAARLHEGLKRFASAAGDVRDAEVLAETLQRITLPSAIRERVDAWLALQASRERDLRAQVAEQLAPLGDLARALSERAQGEPSLPGDGSRLSREEPSARARLRRAPMSLSHTLTLAQELPLRNRAAAISTRALVLHAIHEASAEAAKRAAQPDAEVPDALHRLRIAWKGVRYTGELLSEAIAHDGPAAEALAMRVRTATRMQKRLGEIHDLDEAIASVSRAKALSMGDRMVVHHQLKTARCALVERLEKEMPAALSLLEESA